MAPNISFTQHSQLFPQMKSVKTNISTATWWSRPACVCTITIRRRAVRHVRVWRRDSRHTGATDRKDGPDGDVTHVVSFTGRRYEQTLLAARRSALSAVTAGGKKESKKAAM